MLYLGEPNTNRGMPISTKINQPGVKKASIKPISPINQGTGYEEATGRLMNEDSMTRLLSSGNPKKSMGIVQPLRTNMAPYGVSSPKKPS